MAGLGVHHKCFKRLLLQQKTNMKNIHLDNCSQSYISLNFGFPRGCTTCQLDRSSFLKTLPNFSLHRKVTIRVGKAEIIIGLEISRTLTSAPFLGATISRLEINQSWVENGRFHLQDILENISEIKLRFLLTRKTTFFYIYSKNLHLHNFIIVNFFKCPRGNKNICSNSKLWIKQKGKI